MRASTHPEANIIFGAVIDPDHEGRDASDRDRHRL